MAVLITNRPNHVIVSAPGPQGPAGSGSGSGTVTSVLATSPIVSDGDTSTPMLTHAATALAEGTYTYPERITTDATGHITAVVLGSAPTTGTVTAITTGTGLTGGTINTSGTVSHQAQPSTGTGPAFVKSVEIDALGHVSTVVGESTAGAYRTATGTDDASNLTTGTIPDARLSIASAYTGQIETAAVKTYTIDPSAVHARTVTAFYARSGFGSCTAVLKNEAATVGTVTVTTTSGLAPSIAAASLLVNGLLSIQITTNSAATDVIFSVEYTQ